MKMEVQEKTVFFNSWPTQASVPHNPPPITNEGGAGPQKKKGKKKEEKMCDCRCYCTNTSRFSSFFITFTVTAAAVAPLRYRSVCYAITEAHTRTTMRRTSTVALLRSVAAPQLLRCRVTAAPLPRHYRSAVAPLLHRSTQVRKKMLAGPQIRGLTPMRGGPTRPAFCRSTRGRFAIPFI